MKFHLIFVTNGKSISCEIALNLTDGKPTLVQVMAWCCQVAIDLVPCHHMVSLRQDELTYWCLNKMTDI